MNSISLYAVDDYLLTRIAHRRYFSKDNEIKLIEDFSCAEECVKRMYQYPVDVVLMDIELPKMNGIEATKIIKEKFPKTKVIIFTSHKSEERILASLACGACGYVLKNNIGINLEKVIKMVANGTLSAGHARALISIPQYDQLKIAEEVVKGGLSVRDVEKKVKEYFAPPEEKVKKKVKVELSAELKELIVDMQRVFGTKVNAIGNDKKGRIYIDYYTRDDLDRLSEILEFLKNNKK
jgi:DNA-binding NarL/FixJ family response regulator